MVFTVLKTYIHFCMIWLISYKLIYQAQYKSKLKKLNQIEKQLIIIFIYKFNVAWG